MVYVGSHNKESHYKNDIIHGDETPCTDSFVRRTLEIAEAAHGSDEALRIIMHDNGEHGPDRGEDRCSYIKKHTLIRTHTRTHTHTLYTLYM